MTPIHFYHLTKTPIEKALPKLLEKAYAGGHRVLVKLGSEEQVDYFNHQLWTYAQQSFLPHGSQKEPHAERQPIFLSTEINAPNQADILAVVDGEQVSNDTPFERVLDLFDGTQDTPLNAARTRWKNYKEAGFPLTYHKQNEKGGWEIAATENTI